MQNVGLIGKRLTGIHPQRVDLMNWRQDSGLGDVLRHFYTIFPGRRGKGKGRTSLG
jgi:hypothetical protein